MKNDLLLGMALKKLCSPKFRLATMDLVKDDEKPAPMNVQPVGLLNERGSQRVKRGHGADDEPSSHAQYARFTAKADEPYGILNEANDEFDEDMVNNFVILNSECPETNIQQQEIMNGQLENKEKGDSQSVCRIQ